VSLFLHSILLLNKFSRLRVLNIVGVILLTALHFVSWTRIVTTCSSSLDIEELFDAFLVVVNELSQIVKFPHKFGLLIDIFGDLGIILFLRFLLTVLF
jgi:hypothetical protein